jgi:hypothetical protein
MDTNNYDEILAAISEDITGARTHSRPISPNEKLAITLR